MALQLHSGRQPIATTLFVCNMAAPISALVNTCPKGIIQQKWLGGQAWATQLSDRVGHTSGQFAKATTCVALPCCAQVVCKVWPTMDDDYTLFEIMAPYTGGGVMILRGVARAVADSLLDKLVCLGCAASGWCACNLNLSMTRAAYRNIGFFMCFWPCWALGGGRTMTVFVMASCVLRLRHSACAHARQVLQFKLRKVLLLALWRERA
jgi:hypothetical protein